MDKEDGRDIHIGTNATAAVTDNLTYEQQQNAIPIYYFEPFIKPIESKVLKEVFHVQVLGENNKGKRCVRRRSEERNSIISGSNDDSNDQSSYYLPSTLFYMPFCPMKLYSNVLWANWDPELLFDGRLIIVGNSFKRYNDAMANHVQETAIAPIIPFVNETHVFISQSTRNNRKGTKVNTSGGAAAARVPHHSELSWEDINTALDSTIISFLSVQMGNI